MAMGSTQPLSEMSKRDLPWGAKAAGAYDWQACHLHVLSDCKSWEPQPPRALRAYLGLYRDSFTLPYLSEHHSYLLEKYK
jgi:hypothetical protein